MASNNLELDKAAAIYPKSRVHNTTSLHLPSLPNIRKHFTHSMSTCEQSHAYQDQRNQFERQLINLQYLL